MPTTRKVDKHIESTTAKPMLPSLVEQYSSARVRVRSPQFRRTNCNSTVYREGRWSKEDVKDGQVPKKSFKILCLQRIVFI